MDYCHTTLLLQLTLLDGSLMNSVLSPSLKQKMIKLTLKTL